MEIIGGIMQVVYDKKHGYYKVAKEGYTLHYRNGFIPVIYVTDQSGNVIPPQQYKKYCKAGNVEYLPGEECKKPSWR